MSTIAQPSEWLRGVLVLCVLRAIAVGPSYGYAIAAELAEAGFGEIKGGTLYPLLARHERNGLVTVEWRAGEGGPERKYFTLTETGRAELEHSLTQWQAFSSRVTDHLATDGTSGDLRSLHHRHSPRRTP